MGGIGKCVKSAWNKVRPLFEMWGNIPIKWPCVNTEDYLD